MTPQHSPCVSDMSGLFRDEKSCGINVFADGLQIREDRFDSGTRLHDLADSSRGFSTNFSTFTVHPLFVPGRALVCPHRAERVME